MPQWNFTIPETTPPGKYLLRFEHIFPNEVDAQFYVNCAHVNIENTGDAGTPEPLVKIPGIYERGQPGMYIHSYQSMSQGSDKYQQMCTFPCTIWTLTLRHSSRPHQLYGLASGGV